MEQSILTSTKKILGIPEAEEAFDLDIITHINSTLSVLNQLGLGPTEGFVVEDNSAMWADLQLTDVELSMVRTYTYLKVRMLFDPPGTSFAIEAMNKQIEEHEYRLTYYREGLMTP